MIEIDMKLPSCCDECFAFNDYGCMISGESCEHSFKSFESRMPSCPMKDAEPRVLTLEEVRDEYEVVWLETKYLSSLICLVDNGESNADWLCVVFGVDDRYTLSCHSYGERWRCWSSRPTDERREATPWNT